MTEYESGNTPKSNFTKKNMKGKCSEFFSKFFLAIVVCGLIAGLVLQIIGMSHAEVIAKSPAWLEAKAATYVAPDIDDVVDDLVDDTVVDPTVVDPNVVDPNVVVPNVVDPNAPVDPNAVIV